HNRIDGRVSSEPEICNREPRLQNDEGGGAEAGGVEAAQNRTISASVLLGWFCDNRERKITVHQRFKIWRLRSILWTTADEGLRRARVSNSFSASSSNPICA